MMLTPLAPSPGVNVRFWRKAYIPSRRERCLLLEVKRTSGPKVSPLFAQSGHEPRPIQCPLLGVKRT
jgi:hypothetical protein